MPIISKTIQMIGQTISLSQKKLYNHLFSRLYIDKYQGIIFQMISACLFTGLTAAADVIFLVDASAKVNEGMLVKMKNFIKASIKTMSIDKNLVNVGLVSFGKEIRSNLKLSDGNDVDSVNAAIQDLSIISGKRGIGNALNFIRSQSLTTKNGKRQGVPSFVVLLTTGTNSPLESVDAVESASQLKSRGTIISVIGITETGSEELENIGSGLDHVTFVSAIGDLPMSLQMIESNAADVVGGIPV